MVAGSVKWEVRVTCTGFLCCPQLAMEETALYQEDWIGLRQLQEGGRLVRAHCPGFHMQFTLDWFEEHVVRKYLVVPANRTGSAAAGTGAW